MSVESDRHEEYIEKQLDELRVLHDFWKSAAERALRLWERAEEKSDMMLDAIERAISDPATSLNHKVWHELEGIIDAES